MVIAAFATSIGVSVERIEGNKADDTADQIRTNLQTKLIELMPRSQFLHGQPRSDLIARIRPFAGQKVETRYCEASFTRYFIDPETMSVAMTLPAIVKEARWSGSDFLLRENCRGNAPIEILVSSSASKRTHDAAEGLRFALSKVPFAVSSQVASPKERGQREPDDTNTVVVMVWDHPL
jgi:hypothetical protein